MNVFQKGSEYSNRKVEYKNIKEFRIPNTRERS